MNEKLLVEVQGENGAYYKAFVMDVWQEEIQLSFEKNWQPESRFPFARVRLPPPAPRTPPQFKEEQEVEVFSRASDQESCGWWRAIVKMIKGDFHVVEYLGWDTTYTEIVPSDRLRSKSTEPPITATTFFKFNLAVPEELHEFCADEKALDIHSEFMKAIDACHVNYQDDEGVLVVISSDENSQKRAGMLQDIHYRNISQRLVLLTRMEEAAKHLEATKLQTSNGYTVMLEDSEANDQVQIQEGSSFDWDNLANKVKSKVDEEITEKKAVYDTLMKKKRVEFKKLNKIKADLELHKGVEREAAEQIFMKEKEIKSLELKLKEVKGEKVFLTDQMDVAIMMGCRKWEEMGNLQVKISKIEEEIKGTFVVAGESLSKRNEELFENNSTMKEFLRETISKKESLLECPVCFHTSSPPIYKCPKEHLICSNCLPRMNNKCPTCRTGFAKTDRISRLAEENWSELQKMKSKLDEM